MVVVKMGARLVVRGKIDAFMLFLERKHVMKIELLYGGFFEWYKGDYAHIKW